ncbi:MAG: hypothetical protein ACKOJF_19710, partial [Planctomycetaceae bacterium]
MNRVTLPGDPTPVPGRLTSLRDGQGGPIWQPGRPAWTVWLWLALVALTAARPTPAPARQSAPAEMALEEGETG